MKIVMTGGGTGGHIYPAIAIAKALQQDCQAEIYYIGGTRGLEAKIVQEAGFPFVGLHLEGFKRSFSWHNFKVIGYALNGIRHSKRLLREIKPDAVIGTGGYVCGPVILAASQCKIPAFLHEQNAFPGITNRLLARRVQRVMLTFAEAAGRFPASASTVVTGLPVRPEVLQANREQARQELGLDPETRLVLAFGGSQGSARINQAMLEWFEELKKQELNLKVILVVGPQNYESFQQKMAARNLLDWPTVEICSYLEHLPQVLAAADLAVCRAGAATLAELTVLGIPAILVPYPYATANHQEFNARSLEKVGAAKVIVDQDLNGVSLEKAVRESLASPQVLQQMAAASRQKACPQAIHSILKEVRQFLPV
ncbi:MAG: undecaprenyldiphospho-muramoylpentapeptide beta-N-acetylglucosaminyltransferase [Clostridia bacterium]|nr:undecaprenyldiphospho-muramoylpentapeptide beta-N-acetylglucosaminyltransferase [Clostridia bacterium]